MARSKFQTLTEQMLYILLCLQTECCGIDIMDRVPQLTAGRVQVGSGTLYNLLEQFLDADETGEFVPTAKNDRLYLPWVLLAAILVMGYGVSFDAFHIMGSDSRPKDGPLISTDAIRGTVGGNAKYDTAFQSSPFLTQYKGWQYPTDGDSLSYTVVDVRLPALIEPCLEQMLHSRDEYGDHQEDYDPDSPFYVYQPSSPAPWQADGVWQLYSYGTPNHIYLLRYGSRLVELDLRWEPSPEEIGRAAAILTPDSN